MPNWKRVIVSGSSAHLNQITGSTFRIDGNQSSNFIAYIDNDENSTNFKFEQLFSELMFSFLRKFSNTQQMQRKGSGKKKKRGQQYFCKMTSNYFSIVDFRKILVDTPTDLI